MKHKFFKTLILVALLIPSITHAQVTSNFWKYISNTLSPNVIGLADFKIPYLSSCDTIDTDVDGNLSCGTDSGGSPGGSSGELQWNNTGSFGGVTPALYDGTTLTLNSFNTYFVGKTDPLKRLRVDTDAAATSTTLRLLARQTSDITVTLPVVSTALIGGDSTDVLTNKTITDTTNILGGVTMTLVIS